MDRRFFLQYLGCGCLTIGISSCSSVPITERKQLKIIPEANLNAQAAQIYEKVKSKEKLSDDIGQLKKLKILVKEWKIQFLSILIEQILKIQH